MEGSEVGDIGELQLSEEFADEGVSEDGKGNGEFRLVVPFGRCNFCEEGAALGFEAIVSD